MRHEVKSARVYLSQIRNQGAQLAAIMNQIDKLKKSQIYLSGISYDRERVQTSPSGSASYEDDVIELADLEKAAREKALTMEGRRQHAITLICEMENPAYLDILYKRYVDGMTNMEIADKAYLSEQWIRHQASDALLAFYNANALEIEAYMASRDVA